MNTLRLEWSHGKALLQSLGAMLAPVDYTLSDGRVVSPLHKPPWANEPPHNDIPPILQALRGEWPCVPFGAADVSAVNDRWRVKDANSENDPHGYAANAHWQLQRPNDAALKATINYPSHSAIESLERDIQGVDGKSELALKLTIHPRRDTRLPIGLHPVFRLPEKVHDVQLIPDQLDSVWTYPADTGGPTLFAPDRQCDLLTKIPGAQGTDIDASHLPFTGNNENLLLLTGTQGRFDLLYRSEGFRVVLQWNAEHFPSVLLWISNRGRQNAPWSERHLALGVEPICAAFDFGTDMSNSENPLSQQGTNTTLALRAGEPWQTHYSISVEPA